MQPLTLLLFAAFVGCYGCCCSRLYLYELTNQVGIAKAAETPPLPAMAGVAAAAGQVEKQCSCVATTLVTIAQPTGATAATVATANYIQKQQGKANASRTWFVHLPYDG